MKITKIIAPLIFLCLLGLMVVAFPTIGRSESTARIGLERGERDTMRLDLRVKGSDHKDKNNAIRDQMIGAEERRIRQEQKEKELLRQEEGPKKSRRTAETDEGLKKRKREEERVRDKKTKNYMRTLK